MYMHTYIHAYIHVYIADINILICVLERRMTSNIVNTVFFKLKQTQKYKWNNSPTVYRSVIKYAVLEYHLIRQVSEHCRRLPPRHSH